MSSKQPLVSPVVGVFLLAEQNSVLNSVSAIALDTIVRNADGKYDFKEYVSTISKKYGVSEKTAQNRVSVAKKLQNKWAQKIAGYEGGCTEQNAADLTEYLAKQAKGYTRNIDDIARFLDGKLSIKAQKEADEKAAEEIRRLAAEAEKAAQDKANQQAAENEKKQKEEEERKQKLDADLEQNQIDTTPPAPNQEQEQEQEQPTNEEIVTVYYQGDEMVIKVADNLSSDEIADVIEVLRKKYNDAKAREMEQAA